MRFITRLLFLNFFIICKLNSEVLALEDPLAQDFKNKGGHENSQFYLIFLDKSDEIFTQGGHIAIRFVNTPNKIDRIFHWGLFNFNTKNFALKFYQGNLVYRFGSIETKILLKNEIIHYPRNITQSKINLNNSQKEKLIDRLRYWNKAENKSYLYHIWKKKL